MSLSLKDKVLRYQNLEFNAPYIFYGLVICLLGYLWKSTQLKNPSGLPVIGRRWYELGNGRARQRFREDCLGVVRSSLEKVSDVPIPIDFLYLRFLL
jgi:cytochrome P450 monooxygenase-1